MSLTVCTTRCIVDHDVININIITYVIFYDNLQDIKYQLNNSFTHAFTIHMYCK